MSQTGPENLASLDTGRCDGIRAETAPETLGDMITHRQSLCAVTGFGEQVENRKGRAPNEKKVCIPCVWPPWRPIPET